MIKRWPRRAITIIAAIFLFMAIILVLLHTRPVGNFLFNQLRGYLKNAAGFDLRADSLRLNLLKGSAQLGNLSIRSIQTPELPPVFEAAALYAQVSILEAVRGNVVIRELSLERP